MEITQKRIDQNEIKILYPEHKGHERNIERKHRSNEQDEIKA